MTDPLSIVLTTGNFVHIEDGVSRTLGRLVRFLEADGHRVLVLAPTVEQPAVPLPPRFVPVPSVPIPGRPEYRFSTGFPASVRREVEAFQPDILHVATPDVAGHRSVTWARARNLPIVTTYHTHFVSYLDYYRLGVLRPLFRGIAQRFYNRCDEVLVPTPAMEEDLRTHGVRTPISLWPRGIELERFSPARRSDAWREAHGFAPDDRVVLFVSRLVKEKGLDVYVEVVRRLAPEGVRALVVGDGPEREALAAALPGAILTGHLSGDELATAYASSDLFLFPSETETFGNVTLEAMASGLAVVCADAAGSRSLIADGATGRLCPPRDADAFTHATRALARDEDARRRLGTAAREAASGYDWPDVLARMVEAYRRVIDCRPDSTPSRRA